MVSSTVQSRSVMSRAVGDPRALAEQIVLLRFDIGPLVSPASQV